MTITITVYEDVTLKDIIADNRRGDRFEIKIMENKMFCQFGVG